MGRNELYILCASIGIELIALGVGIVLSPVYGWWIAGFGLLVLIVFLKLAIKERGIRDNTAKYPQRLKAGEMHNNLINLEKVLWSARDSVSKDKDPQENAEVKQTLADIKSEINNLATLVDNHKFETLLDALFNLYLMDIEFDANPYDLTSLTIYNEAHSRIRWFINHKVKD
ncbi:hypothetical protein ACFLYE_03045 [Chloroflexota bacterium]